jgi:hypothetical protein
MYDLPRVFPPDNQLTGILCSESDLLSILRTYPWIFRIDRKTYLYPESFEWYIEGQVFSRSYDLVPRPPALPYIMLDRQRTGRLRKRDNLLTVEGGRGWARSRIIRPQESPLLFCISFNTLCPYPSNLYVTPRTIGWKFFFSSKQLTRMIYLPNIYLHCK